MGTGLLLAALVAIGPFAADEDFYGHNPVTLLNDPKIAPLVGVTEDQKPYLQQDLNDWVTLLGDRAKLQGAKSNRERETDAAELAKLEQQIATLEPIVAEFDARHDAIRQTCVARLTPEQYQRLRELSWQLLGVEAFSMRRHYEKLGMSGADLAMASGRAKEVTAKFRELSAKRRSPEPARSESLKELGAFEREIVAKIVPQLQPSTRATYEIFAGEPAAISKWELRTSFGIEPVQLPKPQP